MAPRVAHGGPEGACPGPEGSAQRADAGITRFVLGLSTGEAWLAAPLLLRAGKGLSPRGQQARLDNGVDLIEGAEHRGGGPQPPPCTPNPHPPTHPPYTQPPTSPLHPRTAGPDAPFQLVNSPAQPRIPGAGGRANFSLAMLPSQGASSSSSSTAASRQQGLQEASLDWARVFVNGQSCSKISASTFLMDDCSSVQ